MELLRLFPEEQAAFWEHGICQKGKELTEIRLRANKAACLYVGGQEYYLGEDGFFTAEKKKAKVFTRQELGQLLLHFCKYSPYAFEEQIRGGYLTLEGGHRLGVAGQVVMEKGEIKTIKNITFLNLRIAREYLGMADDVLPWIYEKGELKNCLIVSPPGCGKTSLLRDMIRQISDGNPYGKGRTVGVVDERSELGGNFMGLPQNDLGCRTDVMDGCPKTIGMRLLVRSMAPKVMAVDELGGREDWTELREISRMGVKIVATIHGNGREDLDESMTDLLFQEVVFLQKKNGIPSIAGHVGIRRGGRSG